MDKNWFNPNLFIRISRSLLKLFIMTIDLLKKKTKKKSAAISNHKNYEQYDI